MSFLGLVPVWMSDSFPIIRFVLLGFIALCSIALIVAVLFQSSEGSNSTNVLTGVTESYFSKNKGHSKEAKLKKITIICASLIVAFTVLYFITLVIEKALG